MRTVLSLFVYFIVESVRAFGQKREPLLPSINQTVYYRLGYNDTLDEILSPACRVDSVESHKVKLSNISSPFRKIDIEHVVYPLSNPASSLLVVTSFEKVVFVDDIGGRPIKPVTVSKLPRMDWTECTDSYYRPNLRRLFVVCKGSASFAGPHFLLLIEVNDPTGKYYRPIPIDMHIEGSLKIVNSSDSLLIFSPTENGRGFAKVQECTGVFEAFSHYAACAPGKQIDINQDHHFLSIMNIFRVAEGVNYFFVMGTSKDSANLVFKVCEMQYQTSVVCLPDTQQHSFSVNPLVYFLPGHRYFEIDVEKGTTWLCSVTRDLQNKVDSWFYHCDTSLKLNLPAGCEPNIVSIFQTNLFISLRKKLRRAESCGFFVTNTLTKESYLDPNLHGVQWEEDIVSFYPVEEKRTLLGLSPTTYYSSLVVNRQICASIGSVSNRTGDTECRINLVCNENTLQAANITFNLTYLHNKTGTVQIDPHFASRSLHLYQDSYFILPTQKSSFLGNSLSLMVKPSEEVKPLVSVAVFHTYELKVFLGELSLNESYCKDVLLGEGYAFCMKPIPDAVYPRNSGTKLELYFCSSPSIDVIRCSLNQTLRLENHKIENRLFGNKTDLMIDGIIYATLCNNQASILGVLLSSPLLDLKFIPFAMDINDIQVKVLLNAKVIIAVAVDGKAEGAGLKPSVNLYSYDLISDSHSANDGDSDPALNHLATINHLKTQSGLFCPVALEMSDDYELAITSECMVNGVSTDHRIHYVQVDMQNFPLIERPIGMDFSYLRVIHCGDRLIAIGTYLNEAKIFATTGESKSFEMSLIHKMEIGLEKGKLFCHSSDTIFSVMYKGMRDSDPYVLETYHTNRERQADNWLDSRVVLAQGDVPFHLFSLQNKIVRMIQPQLTASIKYGFKLLASQIQGPILFATIGKDKQQKTRIKGYINITATNLAGEQATVKINVSIDPKVYNATVEPYCKDRKYYKSDKECKDEKANVTTNSRVDLESFLNISGSIFYAKLHSETNNTTWNMTSRIHQVATYQPILPIHYSTLKYCDKDYLVAAGYKTGYIHVTVLRNQKYFDSMVFPIIGKPDTATLYYNSSTSSLYMFATYSSQVIMLTSSKMKSPKVEYISPGIDVALCDGGMAPKAMILRADGQLVFGRIHNDKGWVEDLIILTNAVSVSAHFNPVNRTCHFVILDGDLRTMSSANSSADYQDDLSEFVKCRVPEGVSISKIRCKVDQKRFFCISNSFNESVLETDLDSCTTYYHDKIKNIDITSMNAAGNYIVAAARGMHGTENSNYRGILVWKTRSVDKHIFYHLNLQKENSSDPIEFDLMQSMSPGQAILVVSSLSTGNPLNFFTISNLSLIIKNTTAGLNLSKLLLYYDPDNNSSNQQIADFPLDRIINLDIRGYSSQKDVKPSKLNWELRIIFVLVFLIVVMVSVVWFRGSNYPTEQIKSTN